MNAFRYIGGGLFVEVDIRLRAEERIDLWESLRVMYASEIAPTQENEVESQTQEGSFVLGFMLHTETLGISAREAGAQGASDFAQSGDFMERAMPSKINSMHTLRGLSNRWLSASRSRRTCLRPIAPMLSHSEETGELGNAATRKSRKISGERWRLDGFGEE